MARALGGQEEKNRSKSLILVAKFEVNLGGRRLTQLQTLIEEIPKYQPAANLDLLERAYRFSERSHQGQQRASGEPYLSHPLEVAGLLVDFKMDVTTVTAGLLHEIGRAHV